MVMSGYLATQADIIKSPTVAQKVVKTLRLTDNQEMRARWESETKGRGDFTVWLSQIISRGLDVNQFVPGLSPEAKRERLEEVNRELMKIIET